LNFLLFSLNFPQLSITQHFIKLFATFYQKKQIKIQGDGSPYRAYLYTADLVIWLLKILFEGKAFHPYNVGSDEAINLEKLAK